LAANGLSPFFSVAWENTSPHLPHTVWLVRFWAWHRGQTRMPLLSFFCSGACMLHLSTAGFIWISPAYCVMMPNIDPKNMAKMMKQMGIQSQKLPARRVVIEQEDGRIIIDSPQVTQITVQGQATFQIAGQVSRQSGVSAEDLKMVMESAGVDDKAARAALEASKGDIAEAIMKLQEKK
jgi:nascent polypeptide-associated complex subunit alpha